MQAWTSERTFLPFGDHEEDDDEDENVWMLESVSKMQKQIAKNECRKSNINNNNNE